LVKNWMEYKGGMGNWVKKKKERKFDRGGDESNGEMRGGEDP